MQITSYQPNTSNTSVVEPVVITFDKNVDASTVDKTTFVVSAKKTDVLKVDNGFAQSDNKSARDDFFSEGFTGILKGNISVANNRITFTPQIKYSPNTRYQVTLSSAIKSVDGDGLSKIMVFSFTTREDDVTDILIENQPQSTRIIGTDVFFDNTSVQQTGLYVTDTNPLPDSFLISSNEITITLSEEITNTPVIKIYRYELLSDYPPERITTFQTGVNGSEITITIPEEEIYNNRVFQIILSKGLRSQNNTLSSDYKFSYVTVLKPYYSSTKLVRLKAGTLLTRITDITIALAIYYASIEANDFLGKLSIEYTNKEKMRSKYALYTSIYSLLMNNFGFGLHDFVKKSLAEFSVAVSNKTQISLYNELIKEAKEFKRHFQHYINFVGTNRGVISRQSSGEIGRLWDKESNYPGLNTTKQAGIKSRYEWDESELYTLITTTSDSDVDSDEIYQNVS